MLRWREMGLGVLLGSTLVGASACGGSSSAPADATAAASQRLQGDWRLQSFTPSLALEEPLRGLLSAQLSTMTVRFSADEFSASGPSVNTSGRYEITSAQGDALSGRVFDRAGASYGISGQFVGSEFRFTSEDPPWAGFGVLTRAQ